MKHVELQLDDPWKILKLAPKRQNFVGTTQFTHTKLSLLEHQKTADLSIPANGTTTHASSLYRQPGPAAT